MGNPSLYLFGSGEGQLAAFAYAVMNLRIP